MWINVEVGTTPSKVFNKEVFKKEVFKKEVFKKEEWEYHPVKVGYSV